MNILEEIQKLEPTVKEAGQLAVKMQKTAKHRNKFNSGNAIVDIVTEADLAVQEFLLRELVKTPLADCKLLAEENTPTAEKFTGKLDYYLAIDPIDGTAIYARGLDFFSTIISVHDGEKPIYHFKYFPLLNWTQKIVENNYESTGNIPTLNLPAISDKTIIFYQGEPEKKLGKIYDELISQGLTFSTVSSITENVDGTSLFILGEVAGYYCQDLNAYDALVNLHYAQATGKKYIQAAPTDI